VPDDAQRRVIAPAAAHPAMKKNPTQSLRALRQATGLSLRALAEEIGVQPTNLSYWERSGKPPRADLVMPIAEALGVSPEEVLGREKPAHGGLQQGRVREVFEQVQKLPRRQQDQILEVVEALLEKAQKDRR
jgi:transcriptional regulator with XRE-family HTH domain